MHNASKITVDHVRELLDSAATDAVLVFGEFLHGDTVAVVGATTAAERGLRVVTTQRDVYEGLGDQFDGKITDEEATEIAAELNTMSNASKITASIARALESQGPRCRGDETRPSIGTWFAAYGEANVTAMMHLGFVAQDYEYSGCLAWTDLGHTMIGIAGRIEYTTRASRRAGSPTWTVDTLAQLNAALDRA